MEKENVRIALSQFQQLVVGSHSMARKRKRQKKRSREDQQEISERETANLTEISRAKDLKDATGAGCQVIKERGGEAGNGPKFMN